MQIFTGNTDNNAPSANSFSPPIEAQYIRIYPQVCRKHCTLRMELLGCELTGLCFDTMGTVFNTVMSHENYVHSCNCFFRMLRAHRDEDRTHPGLSNNLLQCVSDPEHGHVLLGTLQGQTGQTGQGQCMDVSP